MTLHEAIVLVLQEMPNKTGSFAEIASAINEGNFYSRKDGQKLPPYQVKMRSTLSKGKYAHLFEKVGSDSIRLR